jgi:WD40-like Beta Propeller Repeat
LDIGAVLDAPHIVFRSSAPGPTYGLVAAVPLADPAGVRSVTNMSCDRVYASALGGICLAAQRGAITKYSAELLNGRLIPQRPLQITGIPSRARLSPDSSWAATTAFIGGHGYGTIGFSTATTIVQRGSGNSLGNLEKTFKTLINGQLTTATDLNIWGVTFAPGPDPNLFYATVATGGNTWLARGDIAARTLTAIRQDAECPSLSPDGKTLVYKKRAGSQVRWRYHVLDLKTGVERPLSETRSIDDQAEWLDDNHVLYALARTDSGEIDVWEADVRTSAKPVLFMRDASSPAVVRTAAEAAPTVPTPSISGAEPGSTAS